MLAIYRGLGFFYVALQLPRLFPHDPLFADTSRCILDCTFRQVQTQELATALVQALLNDQEVRDRIVA